ncbi:MAG: ribose-phosphate pyrophosphokinase [Candidatus Saccharibacteria bacterium]|nr:ribose-phosphate pyrophosphokinase [Candidatus Saccharibacteria bacterium]
MIKGFGIVSGGVQAETAASVAKILGTKVLKTELKEFSNGERYARLEQNVRNLDLFIFNSCTNTKSYTLNDALIETLIIIDAAKRASSSKISVVLPLFPYARQDRKTRTRESITSALVLQLLKQAGADRIVTVDLHSTQSQAAFFGPFENLSAHPLLIKKVKNLIKKHQDDCVIIAPDAGSVKNSSRFAKELEIPLVFIPKSRDKEDSSKIIRPKETENVAGKTCIIIDDMIDTGGTIISAAEMLKNAKAAKIIVCATHSILSADAANKIYNSPIDLILTTDSVPQQSHQKILGDKIQVISIAPLLADAIKSIQTGNCTLDID